MNTNLSTTGTSILTAFASSLCCITPLLAAISGATGVAGAFSWVEPIRPYLIVATLGVLGFAWFLKLRPQPKDQCGCETPQKSSFFQGKSFLGIVTVLALLLTAFPAYAGLFFTGNENAAAIETSDANPNVKLAEFTIEGMTCTSCESHVKKIVEKLPGIVSVKASHEKGNAIVKFDETKVNTGQIEKAITSAGYKVEKTAMLDAAPSFSNPSSVPISPENVTFYKVPLVCGAAPDIACGSRIKPLFIETEKEIGIVESWINRPGTVVAIVWNAPVPDKNKRNSIMKPLFQKHTIDASLISQSKEIKRHISSLQGEDKWYKGMDVDQLSIEEAGVIAASVTELAKDEGLISEQEALAIKKEVEAYFQKELTQVRTYENLKSEETQDRWYSDTYQTYVKHIGEERAQKVKSFYTDYKEKNETCKPGKKSCCDKKSKKGCCKSK